MNSALNASDTGLQIMLNGGGSSAVKIFLLLTALSFATGIMISITSFARVIIVLSFLRQGLGTPQLPPNQVLLAMAVALTAFTMTGTAKQIYQEGLGPYLDDQIDHVQALERSASPLREFMLRQTRERDIRLFLEISQETLPENAKSLPMTVVIPAFMISELTTAFRMGLYVYVPLLVVDLLVSAILMALGMMMVPPTLVSLPIKIGIFLLADGWHLVMASLAKSF